MLPRNAPEKPAHSPGEQTHAAMVPVTSPAPAPLTEYDADVAGNQMAPPWVKREAVSPSMVIEYCASATDCAPSDLLPTPEDVKKY